MLERAAQAIASARHRLVTAGAGMGVDSGLPDFRGNEGFWKAYPPFASLGLSFVELANPRWFERDPELAWGFYGHRLMLYRRTVPHAGFALLRQWGAGFVFTSNVDGQFHKAGFDQVLECHGSLHHLQCLRGCGQPLWPATCDVAVDEATMRALDPLPSCPGCGGLARPNVLMFGDGGWDDTRTAEQEAAFAAWLASVTPRELCVIELGAGTGVPTVRHTSEALLRRGASLVRINVREPEGPPGTISLAMGALAATRALAPHLR